jgi:hypothetical protein
VSVDEQDDDPILSLTYVATALKRLALGYGVDAALEAAGGEEDRAPTGAPSRDRRTSRCD